MQQNISVLCDLFKASLHHVDVVTHEKQGSFKSFTFFSLAIEIETTIAFLVPATQLSS